MVLITSTMTGLFAAMLRSAFAVIFVAFMIAVLFSVALFLYGTSLAVAGLVVLGFNAGLMLYGAFCIFFRHAGSAS